MYAHYMAEGKSKYVRTEADYAMDAAIKRIFAKYGTNMAAFFRDVEAELAARDAERDRALREKYGVTS